MKQKRWNTFLLCLLLLLRPHYGTAQETLLCPQNIDRYFTLHGDGMPGKSVGIVTPLRDQTFLVGETGNTCYHVDDVGNIIAKYTIEHPDFDGDGIHIKAGGQFNHTFVFAAYDYQRDISYIAIADPDGTMRYSEPIPAAINDTVLLDDGMLLCGSMQARDHVSSRNYMLPWAAKINGVGDIVWQYTEKTAEKKPSKSSRVFTHCVADSDAYYFIRVEHNQNLLWSVLQIDNKGLVAEENLLPLEQYQQYGSVDIRKALLNHGELLLLVSAYNKRGEKINSILATKGAEFLWAHDISAGRSILSFSTTEGGYVCVSAAMTETFSEIDLLLINNTGRIIQQLPFSRDDATQELRSSHLLSRLVQNDADLWGVGVLSCSSPDEARSWIYMVRFNIPAFISGT